MAKLVYQEPEDYFIRVSAVSMMSFLNIHPFSINVNAEKIQTILLNSVGANFIMFPEYTYSAELEKIYQDYSNENNCVIIGGSGLEEIGHNYYAYCPIFLPNSPIIKVYKKFITAEETISSGGRLIGYNEDVQRTVVLSLDERELSFSVYVCYDFIIENKEKRSDIIFIPQYEGSPEQFINEGDRISKGYRNFVLGCNNCNNNQRSIGFALLNSSIIELLHLQNFRRQEYNDMNNKHLNQHHTIFYDICEERIVSFNLNIGRPYSLAFNYNLQNIQPVLVPIQNISI